jgi:hypothetical protein
MKYHFKYHFMPSTGLGVGKHDAKMWHRRAYQIGYVVAVNLSPSSSGNFIFGS